MNFKFDVVIETITLHAPNGIMFYLYPYCNSTCCNNPEVEDFSQRAASSKRLGASSKMQLAACLEAFSRLLVLQCPRTCLTALGSEIAWLVRDAHAQSRKSFQVAVLAIPSETGKNSVAGSKRIKVSFKLLPLRHHAQQCNSHTAAVFERPAAERVLAASRLLPELSVLLCGPAGLGLEDCFAIPIQRHSAFAR